MLAEHRGADFLAQRIATAQPEHDPKLVEGLRATLPFPTNPEDLAIAAGRPLPPGRPLAGMGGADRPRDEFLVDPILQHALRNPAAVPSQRPVIGPVEHLFPRHGLGEITVEVIEAQAECDLHDLAFALNAAHGRPLTLNDRRAYAARLLRAYPDWSDREIGRRAGLVQPTIAKVRQDLEREREIPPATTRTGRDGRSYPATLRPAGGPPAPWTRIEHAFTPAERIAQRRLVHYLQRLAEVLEEQDDLDRFETLDAAAEACRVVLGEGEARGLAGRLGWSSRNIVAIAEALGDRDGEKSAS